MNLRLESINSWLTLCANIGVLIGIIFLAIEIQQNTKVNRGIAIDAIQTGVREQLMAAVENPELISLIIRARRNDELTLEERGILSFYFGATLLQVENAYYQKEAGLITEDFFNSLNRNIEATTRENDIARRYWENNKSNYTREFQEYVDSLPPEGQN